MRMRRGLESADLSHGMTGPSDTFTSTGRVRASPPTFHGEMSVSKASVLQYCFLSTSPPMLIEDFQATMTDPRLPVERLFR